MTTARSGHGTPRSVSSATSYYDQEDDDDLDEQQQQRVGAASDAEESSAEMGPASLLPSSVLQEAASSSPAYFRDTASSRSRSSLLAQRPKKDAYEGVAGARSSVRWTTTVTASSRRSSSSAPASAASPRAGEVLLRLQQQLGSSQQQHNGPAASHRVVHIQEPPPGEAQAQAGRPLLVLEFHEITYTVHKKKKRSSKSSKWWPPWIWGRESTATPAAGASERGSSPPSGMTELASAAPAWTSSPPSSPPTGRRRSSTPTTTTSSSASTSSSSSKVLLNEVSGAARDGEILAVMGPSGSGKSTLIDALAQRIARDSLRGSLTLNGEAVSARLLRSISAYVMQDDLLFPMLTVHETLMFAADVRLPASQHSRAKKRARVAALLEQLGLARVAHTIIGDEGHRGVSGGERRRVSIGIDIVHDPLLLFLDEPTSGLDSTSAYMVVRTLQRIAHSGSIVILSIHQPSYRILGLLDRLILLAHGHKIYGGPPADIGGFFAEFGRPIPAHENSTEFALDLIAELQQQQGPGAGGIKPLVEFYKVWSGKAQQQAHQQGLLGHVTDVRGAISASISRGKLVATRASFHLHLHDDDDGHDSSSSAHAMSDHAMVVKFANPWYAEIPVLIRRTVINISRTPELFLMRLATVIITGFLLATIFWGLDHSPRGVQERLGFFAFAMSTTYYTCADALPVFLQERYIFMRETAHNAYRKSSYVLANALIYIPFLALLSISFAVVIWWAVGLSGGAPGFGFFFLIIWASFWAGNSFVTFLSAVMPNVMLGYTVVVAMLAYFLLLSGFFIARNRIPHYWIWFHYLSIIKYPYEAVLINEFRTSADQTPPCFETGAQILYGTPLAGLPTSVVANMLATLDASLPASSPYKNLNVSSCVTDGSVVLRNQYVTQLGKWACLGVTVAFGVLFRLCFYIVLRLGGKNTRH